MENKRLLQLFCFTHGLDVLQVTGRLDKKGLDIEFRGEHQHYKVEIDLEGNGTFTLYYKKRSLYVYACKVALTQVRYARIFGDVVTMLKAHQDMTKF